jgi:rSAM/selenodomain-associated transferase 2
MLLSVIIPTINEGKNIKKLVEYLFAHADKRLLEVLVIDGGSTDNTMAEAEQAGAKVFLCPVRSRASQMNFGAAKSSATTLYFVHADAIPPKSFLDDIEESLQKGYHIGCFRFKFDSSKFMLKINSYCTRFDRIMCRGGDQTLFVTTALFKALGCYDENYLIMEEYQFISKARKTNPFIIIPKDVLVSARKYDTNSYVRVNLSNLFVFAMFFLKIRPEKISKTYKKLLNPY